MRTSRRELTLATLSRQSLLERSDEPARDAVRRLAGLNAQTAVEPYLTLWTRLRRFVPDDLTKLLHDRVAVRAAMVRNTQHIVDAQDYLDWRTALQPVLDRSRKGFFGRATGGVDLDELAEAGRALLGGEPMPRPELGRALAARWPGHDSTALARSVQALLPIVHPPSAMTWERRGGATQFVLAGEWLGREPDARADPAPLLRRYLSAFGPSGVPDMQVWSGLTRLREIVERMAPDLHRSTGPDGEALYDLPDAIRPDPDTDPPVRLLPQFDNLLVSHRDRRRILADDHRPLVCIGAEVKATVLVDGAVAGLWRVERTDGGARAFIDTFEPLPRRSEEHVTREAIAALAFLDGGADPAHEVRVRPLG